MIGTAAKLISGLGTIATRGTGLNAARKFGLGSAAVGFGITKAVHSDFASQYLVGQYGEEKGGARAGTLKTIGSIAGIGLMGYGGAAAIRGKVSTLGVGTTLKTGSKGLSAAGKFYASGYGIKKVHRGLSTWKGGFSGASKALKPLTHTAKVLTGRTKFQKKHPFITKALPLGMAGGAIAGSATAANRRSRTTGAHEGTITSVRGFQYGSMAPSLQFSSSQGMFKKLNRRGGRVN